MAVHVDNVIWSYSKVSTVWRLGVFCILYNRGHVFLKSKISLIRFRYTEIRPRLFYSRVRRLFRIDVQQYKCVRYP